MSDASMPLPTGDRRAVKPHVNTKLVFVKNETQARCVLFFTAGVGKGRSTNLFVFLDHCHDVCDGLCIKISCYSKRGSKILSLGYALFYAKAL
jgi:hypothetical protein